MRSDDSRGAGRPQAVSHLAGLGATTAGIDDKIGG